MTKERNSQIEILRIISMIAIVMHHYTRHGGFVWEYSDLSVSHFWYNLITMCGYGGVNIFVLISGYYLMRNQTVRLSAKHLLRLYGEVLFYSLAIYGAYLLLTPQAEMDFRSAVRAFLPISCGTWWFASVYFVLYLIHPFLNKLLQNLTRKEYQILLLTTTLLWCVIPSLIGKMMESNSLVWFMYLYTVAGYVRLHGNQSKEKGKTYLLSFAVFFLLSYLSSAMITVLGASYPYFSRHIIFFFGLQKLPTVAWSLALFLYFLTREASHNRLVNLVASTTFGVYLIHDNAYSRPYVWSKLLQNTQVHDSWLIIIHSVGYVLAVFLICSLMDHVRQKLIEKPYISLVSRLIDAKAPQARAVLRQVSRLLFGPRDK